MKKDRTLETPLRPIMVQVSAVAGKTGRGTQLGVASSSSAAEVRWPTEEAGWGGGGDEGGRAAYIGHDVGWHNGWVTERMLYARSQSVA